MGEIFDTYKRNKNPPLPTHICVIIIVMNRMYMIALLHAMWFRDVDYLSLYDITGCVVCCAKCQFHPFLPFSSITMPRPGKYYHLKKRRKIALCGRIIRKCDIYRIIMRVNLVYSVRQIF